MHVVGKGQNQLVVRVVVLHGYFGDVVVLYSADVYYLRVYDVKPAGVVYVCDKFPYAALVAKVNLYVLVAPPVYKHYSHACV